MCGVKLHDVLYDETQNEIFFFALNALSLARLGVVIDSARHIVRIKVDHGIGSS